MDDEQSVAAGAASAETSHQGSGLRGFALGAVTGMVVAALLVGVGLLTGLVTLGAGKEQGPGFASPEAAAMGYLEALKHGDAEEMVKVFAIESFAKNCDYALYLKKFQSHIFAASECPFPKQGAGDGANAVLRGSRVRGEVARVFATHVSPHLNPIRQEVWDVEDLDRKIESFQAETRADFDSYVFADMADVEVLDPMQSETYGHLVKRMDPEYAAMYGVQEVREMEVRFTAGGSEWVFGPLMGRYEGRWYILQAVGTVAAASVVEGGMSGGGLLKKG